MDKRDLSVLVAVIVVAIAGFFGYQYYQNQSADNSTATQESSISATPTPTSAAMEAAPEEVSYRGEAGKTALTLLQEKAEVEMTGEGEMAFVTTINGYKAKNNEFWAFYVNGESSQVGAGTYVTKADDQIEWKIETF